MVGWWWKRTGIDSDDVENELSEFLHVRYGEVGELELVSVMTLVPA